VSSYHRTSTQVRDFAEADNTSSVNPSITYLWLGACSLHERKRAGAIKLRPEYLTVQIRHLNQAANRSDEQSGAGWILERQDQADNRSGTQNNEQQPTAAVFTENLFRLANRSA
jgi:hypothetical protein